MNDNEAGASPRTQNFHPHMGPSGGGEAYYPDPVDRVDELKDWAHNVGSADDGVMAWAAAEIERLRSQVADLTEELRETHREYRGVAQEAEQAAYDLWCAQDER
jgi:hypothetical protein